MQLSMNKPCVVAFAAAVCAMIAASAPGETYFVKPGGNNEFAGTSWGAAFRAIGRAVAAAKAGDEIWVAEGTYLEGAEITIPADVFLRGGFAGTEANAADRPVPPRSTVMDGNVAHACLANYGQVEWMGIARGNGYGVHNRSSGILSDCRVYSCSGTGIVNTAGLVIRCDVHDNSPNSGIKNNGGVVFQCIIRGNSNGSSLSGSGGGIYNDAQGTVVRCRIYGNGVGGRMVANGGGAYNQGIMTNCIVFDNQASSLEMNSNGGGVHNTGTLTNCTIYRNYAQGPAGVSGSGKIINCIIWRNSDSDCGSGPAAIHSGFPEAAEFFAKGYITDEPQFVSTSGEVANWDVSLQPTSPCIDTGTAEGAPVNDLLGTSRPQGLGIDMGAFEWVNPGATPTPTPIPGHGGWITR